MNSLHVKLILYFSYLFERVLMLPFNTRCVSFSRKNFVIENVDNRHKGTLTYNVIIMYREINEAPHG